MELGLWRDGGDSRPVIGLRKYELTLTLPGGPSVCSTKSAFIAGSECGDSTLADDDVVEISNDSPCDDPFSRRSISSIDHRHRHRLEGEMRLARSTLFVQWTARSTIPQRTQILPLSIRIDAFQQRRLNSTSNSKLPPQLPSAGSVNLTPLRGLLALHGPDAAKFLQGLITKIFPSETEPNGMFTSFLSPQVVLLRLFINERDEFCSIHSSIQLPQLS
jgi:hypothetical protein